MIEIIDLMKDLVQFKTMHSRSDEIHRCATFIEQYLNTWDVTYRRLDYHNSPAILVVPQQGIVPILLMSHIDVVDAPDRLFRPVMQDGILYGRGCFDDKYAVALSLVLLKNNLQQLRKQGRGQKELPFGILITSDEEIGGFNGAKKILSKIQTDFCIVLDGGNIEKIVVKEKGVVRVKLVCRVKVNSSSKQWQGKSAVDKLLNDINAWVTYFVKSAPDNPHRKVICTHIHSKQSSYGVPELAEACLEIRYTESDDLEKMFNTMEKELHSDIVVENVEPLFSGGESDHLKLLLEISEKTRIGFEDGANDSRFLSQFGIKGIVWGADGDRSQHTPNEHVDIESVYELYARLDAFITRCESLERITLNTSRQGCRSL
jgi:succinyl-diaminopimelate desuccinylase